MSTITGKLTHPSATGRVPSCGSIICTPSTRRDLVGEIVVPESFLQRLNDDGTFTLELDDTDGTWWWTITEDVARGRTRHVAVAGDSTYADLVDVDPSSGVIKPPLPPIWQTYIDDAIADVQLLPGPEGPEGPPGADGVAVSAANVNDGSALAVALGEKIQTEVGDTLDQYAPGTVLASAERTATFDTTSTGPGAGADIPGLTITVTGNGRPIDLELYLPDAHHSVAGTLMLAYITQVDDGQATVLAYPCSPSIYGGPPVNLKKSVTIADGQTKTYRASLTAFAAGTTSAGMGTGDNSLPPGYLRAIAR